MADIVGTENDDTLDGTADDDMISGGDGNDTLNGGEGDDTLDGGNGDDTLDGGPGNNNLNGGLGDDIYVVGADATDGVTISIEDSFGRDTLDVSAASGALTIDLSGQTATTLGTTTLEFTVTESPLPLDLFFVQDLSGSYSDDLPIVQYLVPEIVATVRGFQPDSRFGLGSFVAIPTFATDRDYAYQTDQFINEDESLFQAAYDRITVRGGDTESTLIALLQVGRRASDEIAFRSDATRIALVLTDEDFGEAGDAAFRGPNNGDDVLDGDPPGSGEDHPSREQVRDALLEAGIIPVFAVTSSVRPIYEELVAEWGFGAVVDLATDSSNIVEAISATLAEAPLVSSVGIEVVIGTAFDDTILGSGFANRLDGGAGNDTLTGLLGEDILEGGLGDDLIDGGDGKDAASYLGASEGVTVDLSIAGPQDTGVTGMDTLISIEDLEGSAFDDRLLGNDERNIIRAEGGDDFVSLGAGQDVAFGGDGNDTLVGGAGEDGLFGALGDDTIFGGEDDDRVFGEEGNDSIYGDGGDDFLVGNLGDDLIDGGAGEDNMQGREGNDTLLGGAGRDIIIGGEGFDTVDYSGNADAPNASRLRIDLSVNFAGNDGFGASDSVVDVENVIGTNRNDIITGNGARNRLEGGAGDDAIAGLGGVDTIFGGDGADSLAGGFANDFLYGEDGDDRLYGEDGNDLLSGGEGNDLLIGNAGIDVLAGGAGDDLLQGRDDDDFLYGEDGNDTLSGGGGDDRLIGNAGDDILIGGTGNDDLHGRDGMDDLSGGEGDDFLGGGLDNDTLSGDAGNDQVYGEEGNDTLSGGEGDDLLVGNGGDDTLNGDDGNDNLRGRDGADTLLGGAGNDYMVGGAGEDSLFGGGDFDTLIGGAGADTFVFEGDWRRDTVGDYTDGEDTLDLSGLSLIGAGETAADAFAKLTFVQDGTTAIISVTGDTRNDIRLSNTDISTLDAVDFLFETPPAASEAQGASESFDFTGLAALRREVLNTDIGLVDAAPAIPTPLLAPGGDHTDFDWASPADWQDFGLMPEEDWGSGLG